MNLKERCAALSIEEKTSILSANLKRLRCTDFTVEELLSHISEEVAVKVATDGSPALLVNGGSVYPELDTLNVVAREAAGLLANQSPDLVVFFGLGLGLHPEALARLTNAPIIVFEPDPVLLATVLSTVSIEGQNIRVAGSLSRLAEVVQLVLGETPGQMVAGALPPWARHHPLAFEGFKLTLQQAVAKVESDRKTRVVFSEDWIQNMAQNLGFLGSHKPLQALKDRFAGKPAILVGAGPSLDQNLKDLVRAKDHALIMAVHTAALPMSRAGITPDLVIIIEGQKLDHYFTDLEDLNRMVLLPSPQTHPVHLELGFKDFLAISHEGNAAADWLEQAYDMTPLRSGGSVACTAFAALHELGCEPIVLAGMDLAYDHNRGHALGTATGCCDVITDEEKGLTITRCREGIHESVSYQSNMITGWGGEKKVATRPVLTAFRDWFELAAQTWAKDRRLINATGGGARIVGFEELELSRVQDECLSETLPAEEIIDLVLKEATLSDPRALASVVSAELKSIAAAIKLAATTDKTAGKAITKLKQRRLHEVQPLLDKLQGQEEELRSVTRQTRLLNTLVGHRAQSLSAETAGNDEVSRTIHSLEMSRQISRLISEGGQELLATFEKPVRDLDGQG